MTAVRGRGEHPVDVTRERLAAARRKVDLAMLERVGVEERFMLSNLVGQYAAIDRLVGLVQADPSKSARLLAARSVDAYAAHVAEVLRAVVPRKGKP